MIPLKLYGTGNTPPEEQYMKHKQKSFCHSVQKQWEKKRKKAIVKEEKKAIVKLFSLHANALKYKKSATSFTNP